MTTARIYFRSLQSSLQLGEMERTGEDKTLLTDLNSNMMMSRNEQDHQAAPRACENQQEKLQTVSTQAKPKARKQLRDQKSKNNNGASPLPPHHQVIVLNGRRRRLTPHPAKLSGAIQRPPSTKKSLASSRGQAIGKSDANKSSEYTCFGCQKPIRDRFLLSACDKFWHDSCLKCDRCQAKLGELGSTLYEKGSMNLCRQDYYEMFGQKAICAVCDKLIYASEMVMRARDNVYHLECFACQLCGLRFCVGDRFHLCDNKIVCQYDYDEHIYPLQYQQQQQQHSDHHEDFNHQIMHLSNVGPDYQAEHGGLTAGEAPHQAPHLLAMAYEQPIYEQPFQERQHQDSSVTYHTMEAYTSRAPEMAEALAAAKNDQNHATPTMMSNDSSKSEAAVLLAMLDSNGRDVEVDEVEEVAKILVDRMVDKAETETDSAHIVFGSDEQRSADDPNERGMSLVAQEVD